MRKLAFILCLAAATTTSLNAAPAKPQIFTVNYPLAYFAERIAGVVVEVVFPAGRGVDPADWHPDTQVVVGYQNADLVLLNGAGYAKWIGAASLRKRRLVDTSAEFRDRYIPIADATTHSHGPQGAHSHGEAAFTTWLDFSLAAAQARAVAAALTRLVPEQAARFDANLRDLEEDLVQLDRRITAAAVGKQLFASHPVYPYFARRYRLDLLSVHWEPGKEPDAALWSDFDQLRKKHPARWMMWEDEPRPETVARLQARGIASFVFSPCGNRPAEGDFLSVMEANIAALEAAD